MGTATVERVEAKEPVARSATKAKMFRYSAYVDVGDGAAGCEHARDGQCDDIEHFHAWARLPNPYQHQDLRAKGLAAKARKIRELRDPDSNASVVLDQTLADLADPAFADAIIDELLTADWAADYLRAQREVSEREEFEHVLQDREEYERLTAHESELSESDRSEDYRRLDAHLTGYMEALRTRLEEIQTPRRVELAERTPEALVALVRSKRVEEEATRAFMDAYDPWMWFVGTFKVAPHPTLRRPHLPMWDEIGHRDRPSAGSMYGEAPEVIETLKRTFNELQVALQKGSTGN
jgi:hypothetical protein